MISMKAAAHIQLTALIGAPASLAMATQLVGLKMKVLNSIIKVVAVEITFSPNSDASNTSMQARSETKIETIGMNSAMIAIINAATAKPFAILSSSVLLN